MMFGKEDSVKKAEVELQEVLGNFRESVHAWSAAEYGRPHVLAVAGIHRTWWLATAWALGCVLALASLSAGLYERHHHPELAQMAAVQQRQQHPVTMAAAASSAPATEAGPVAQSRAGNVDENADWLASVDSDVSRQIPSAMEPLTKLMDSNSIQ